MSERFIDALASTAAMAEVVCDAAWLQAMLDAEAALARAGAAVGLVPADAAETITKACQEHLPDIDALCRSFRATASPVVGLVRSLRTAVPPDVAGYVHRGATTQDIVDTAMALIWREGLELVAAELAGAVEAAAALARAHRDTVMAGRTLLQQASPTTFGLKAAGWMLSLADAERQIGQVRDERATVELGGAVGTQAAFGARGHNLIAAFAAELDLPAPTIPWHTRREGVLAVAAALGAGAAACDKVALDVLLLAQDEVGEVREGSAGRPGSPAAPDAGGSSTLPHKHNPVGAVAIRVAARRALAGTGAFFVPMPPEHERGAGGWQAEAAMMSDLLLAAHAAVAGARDVLTNLEVDKPRMAHNLDATGGLLMAEAVAGGLADQLGWDRAQEVVGVAARRARRDRCPLRTALLVDPQVLPVLSTEALDALLDPSRYVGEAGRMVDDALAELDELKALKVQKTRRANR